MKKGIHYWALPTDMTLAEKFRFAKECGFDGVEPVILKDGELCESCSTSQLKEIRKVADNEGIEIPSVTNSLSWACSFTSDRPSIREKTLDVVKREIEIGYELGLEAVLTLPGFVSWPFSVNDLHPATDTSDDCYHPAMENIRYDRAYERALEGYSKVEPFARSAGIKICIENTWGHFLISPIEMKSFIDTLNSPFIRSYFDIGNVNPFGIPEHWIEILENRIERVHIKDFIKSSLSLDGFVELFKGNLDFEKPIKALKGIGYNGWITAELNVDVKDQKRVAKQASEDLDKIISFGG